MMAYYTLAVTQMASVLSKRFVTSTKRHRSSVCVLTTVRLEEMGSLVAWYMLSVAWLQRGARLNGACAVHTRRDEATEDKY